MFKKILIANRGEIACRVMATCRKMGIATVAVYSDADANALHVRLADEAVRLGPAEAAKSYLNIDAILKACRSSGAEAVHPGYGFLSENPAFATALDDQGIAFIGPPASAITKMGLKDAAKAIMEKAGVPVVPGYHGADQSDDVLLAEATRIGTPLLIKARAGGGGKGMRRVDDLAEFTDALQSARREALQSFGDGAVLIERFVANPRHIEFQILADNTGNIVHLFERDCSLQRRHQKVIEEAPAPGMNDAVRAAMGGAAIEAARAVGYVNAGTVEFIADGSDGLASDLFYFMEMNTRLQVEHPVTEAITGLDLVEQQIRIAAGSPLAFTQADLQIDGHAFEARLYAEDVPAGFLPATGTLERLTLDTDHARIDTGVIEGDAITPHYDPMIAKIITHASSRQAALARMTRALNASFVAGTTTNLGFLTALCNDAAFAQADIDTSLIERHRDELVAFTNPHPSDWAWAAIKAMKLDQGSDKEGFRLWGERGSAWVQLRCQGVEHECEVKPQSSSRYICIIDGERLDIDAMSDDVTCCLSTDAVTIGRQGRINLFSIIDPLDVAHDGGSAEDRILSPMPGLIREVAVAQGDAVSKGQKLLVMEAMKMEQTLASPRDGIVSAIHVVTGEQVDADRLLVELETLQ